MDRKSIRKEMARLISEIGEYGNKLADVQNHFAQPGLDSLMQKVKALYEKGILLDYLQNLEAAAERGEVSGVPQVREVKEPELIRRSVDTRRTEEVNPIKLEEIPEVTGGINQEQVRMPGDDKLEAKSITKPEENKPEVKAEEKPVEKPQASSEPVKKQPEIDLFSGEMPSSNKPAPKPQEKEKLKPAEDKSLARKLQKKPVADLKAAIGINEKFQYVNELFDGNMTEYNIAINQLNICNSYAEAEAYLNTLRELYKWDPESETVAGFAELVERRFL